ncbi:MAG: carboxypeptidase-like regulatory domain-containing protein [Bacteroidota bacterium]|uniref:TonB-dependent receptor n=1 Tax=Flagellimonas profundi TaxID=2915620 RepID=A0ABS3FGP9_9FLAO|nr:carboxypeptidase-like regulatory domain-containing protein [Allomuricauda profundi]MBO0342329.1 TonB-dependent receptor [Allomuricauda profundi]MEC7770965.1 carboxypeptidase-like regulatory domain-containing protein [Bacteroidota bacterium]
MFRYIFSFLVFTLTMGHLANAQQTINGQVVDQVDKQPLMGALVILKYSGKSTLTDNQGYFQMVHRAKADTLLIQYLGYDESRIQVSANTSDLGTIGMQRSNTTLDEVVVSASPKNFKSEFKGSNFRVNPVLMKHINPLSTEEVLRTVPGVNIVGDMGLSNRPNISIRGSWGRRSKKVLLMEDGTPAAPAPYIAPGAYYNPVSDRITSIEVYKGADLLRYGPNNMYGAVNYITALPPQKPTLRLKLTGGQRNYTSGLFSYGGTWNDIGGLVEGVYKKFDGFTDNSSVEILNLNAKIFAKLSDDQSLYFKVSGQFEDNQASLSSQTPFTFETDPTQNPLDADQFTMRRYGVDIIHKWLPEDGLSFTTKVYASDFERDWWRQVTAKVLASEVQDYVGDEIFNDRYRYLAGSTFDDEDYVIVGRVENGLESTTDSRWIYRVSGIKETVNADWEAFGARSAFEGSINLHRETFKDVFLEADNSRWARYGTATKDLWYRLWSANGYVRNEFLFGKLGVTPILRFEHVDMFRQDLLALSQNPDLESTTEGREPNVYNQFLPGTTINYEYGDGEFYGSVYQGMIAPSKVFGFLVEQDGVVTNPLAGQSINIDPELSWNKEIGWRGGILDNHIQGQLTYFHNASRNFYAGGRNEVFTELGAINVQGIELAINAELLDTSGHQLHFLGNVTYMDSKVKAGKLEDRDLFSQVVHGNATSNEYIAKVNGNRAAYEVYVDNGNGEALLTDETLDASQFDNITRSVITFGNEGISDAEAPYTPHINMSLGLNYDWDRLSSGFNVHHVGEQYTEFHNFKNESADGAIGQLPAYTTIDAFVNYDFSIGEKMDASIFVNGKNITDKLYRASRLNRATSGVFGGGFRQIIFGVHLKI